MAHISIQITLYGVCVCTSRARAYTHTHTHTQYLPFVSLTDGLISVWGEATILLVNTVVSEMNETV